MKLAVGSLSFFIVQSKVLLDVFVCDVIWLSLKVMLCSSLIVGKVSEMKEKAASETLKGMSR